jgi:hypothetical protein
MLGLAQIEAADPTDKQVGHDKVEEAPHRTLTHAEDAVRGLPADPSWRHPRGQPESKIRFTTERLSNTRVIIRSRETSA